jgi:acetyl-CoA carboxylase biotin carboxyl carrier protein
VPYTEEEVRQILAAIDRSDWEEVRLEADGLTLVVAKSGPPTLGPVGVAAADGAAAAATAPTGALPAGAAPPARAATPTAAQAGWPQGSDPIEVIDEAHASTPAPATSHARRADVSTVLAPSLGLFWRSPKPGAPPFVDVGDRVDADSTVCIVEVMKLMNHVKAGCTGVVTAIHANNGEMVEYGQPLLTIAPE